MLLHHKLPTPPGCLIQQVPAAGRHAHKKHSRRGVVRAEASRGPSDPFDDTTKRALREAAEILSEAQELAQQQTLNDLMSSWTADSTTTTTTAAAAGQAADVGAQPQPSSSSSSAAGSAAAAAPAPSAATSSAAALEAFWCEQGLSQAVAQKLLKEVQADPQLAASCMNTQLLSQKLASLSRVLPGVDVVQLVVRVPKLLQVPSSCAVQILVDLVNALPGCDVMDMVSRQPRLLLLDQEGLPQRLQAIVNKLQALHPSHMERVVAGIIEENPELVLRMGYYLGDDVRLLDDLPIEIQNMMVLGDHGVGYLYRYWNNRLTERSSSRSEWDVGGSSSSAA